MLSEKKDIIFHKIRYKIKKQILWLVFRGKNENSKKKKKCTMFMASRFVKDKIVASTITSTGFPKRRKIETFFLQ